MHLGSSKWLLMHEFSLAQSVFDTIVSVAEKQNVDQIKKVILKFGMFALVQEEQFKFCFDIVKQDSKVTQDTVLEIRWIPGVLKCLDCNFNGEIEDSPQDHVELAPIFKCPKCQSFSTEVISGTETIIDSLLV